MSAAPPSARPAIYRITVRGRLDANWLPYFAGLTLTYEGELTTLTGPIADQAALRGLLCWLWNLNLTLLSVTRREDDSSPGKDQES